MADIENEITEQDPRRIKGYCEAQYSLIRVAIETSHYITDTYRVPICSTLNPFFQHGLCPDQPPSPDKRYRTPPHKYIGELALANIDIVNETFQDMCEVFVESIISHKPYRAAHNTIGRVFDRHGQKYIAREAFKMRSKTVTEGKKKKRRTYEYKPHLQNWSLAKLDKGFAHGARQRLLVKVWFDQDFRHYWNFECTVKGTKYVLGTCMLTPYPSDAGSPVKFTIRKVDDEFRCYITLNSGTSDFEMIPKDQLSE